eukprot:135802_1
MMSPTSRHTKKRTHSKKRKIDKKRKRQKKRNRVKNKNEPRSGSDIGGVFARVLGVGAFALALWLRVRPKDGNIQPQSSTTSSQRHSSLTSPNNQSRSVQTSTSITEQQPQISSISEKSDEIDIDTSEFGKPLTELSAMELRQLAKSNLGRNYDESQFGRHWDEDEIQFLLKLRKSGVLNSTLAEAFNRDANSIWNRTRREHESYTRRAKGNRRTPTMYDPTMEWRAESALEQLPNNEGTSIQIREIIADKYRDLDCSITAGRKTMPRWHTALSRALSCSRIIDSVGKIGRCKIWSLYTSDDPDGLMAKIEEGERKQRRKKGDFSKRMNKVKAHRK